MPFTQAQAEDYNILNSVLLFLQRNVKIPYDIRAAATLSSNAAVQYSSPLSIRPGEPDDLSITANPPIIAVNTIESTERSRFYGLGQNTLFRHANFIICCFPALDQYARPCLESQLVLKALVRNALSAEYIRVLDRANTPDDAHPVYCYDTLNVVNVSGPAPRGQHSLLAQQKHRFDFHIQVSYAVNEPTVN